jgi:hypothetical protein
VEDSTGADKAIQPQTQEYWRIMRGNEWVPSGGELIAVRAIAIGVRLFTDWGLGAIVGNSPNQFQQ